MICVVTATGGRPRGIELLARYINAQTYTGPLTWIIVDDCDPRTDIPAMRDGIMTLCIDPPWRWTGANTQAQSMSKALEYVPAGAICIVAEDDDLYKPDHFANVLCALNRAELVGERVARYYNVATSRYKVLPGNFHASLASTAVRGGALAMLADICAAGSRRIDIDLWRTYPGAKELLESGNVIGIKGMPGRAGIGVGHQQQFGSPDRGNSVKMEWLGEYAKDY